MASVAVALSAKVLGPLKDKSMLIVGAGDTCRVAVDHLKDAGARDFKIANRTLENARALAARVSGSAHPLSELPALLAGADLVFTATASSHALIDVEMARQASRARRGRGMVMVDLAVPRDIHPDVHRLPNVFLFSTDSVQRVVDANLDRRRREAPRAEAIVAEESARFLEWYGRRSLTPTLATVRAQVEALRARKLADFAGRFRPEDRAKLEELTQSLVDEILRGPTLRLLDAGEDPRRREELAEAVRHLFDLEPGEGGGRGDADRDEG